MDTITNNREIRLKRLGEWHCDSHPSTKNEDGSAKILYHGSLKNFLSFDHTKGETSMFGRGAYLTSSPSDASRYASKSVSDNYDIPGKAEHLAKECGIPYAEARDIILEGNEQVYPLYAKLTKPLVIGSGKAVVADYHMVLNSLKLADVYYPESAAKLFIKLSLFGRNEDDDLFLISSSQRIRELMEKYNDPSIAQLEIIGNQGMRELMISLNCDGIVFENIHKVYSWMEEKSTHYYVRLPESVKSIFNHGSFCERNSDLTETPYLPSIAFKPDDCLFDRCNEIDIDSAKIKL